MLEALYHSNYYLLILQHYIIFVDFLWIANLGYFNWLLFFFYCRSDATQFLRSHRMPHGSVDSEDGNALDDELNTLLPGTREISADDLSQVLALFHWIQFKFIEKCEASGTVSPFISPSRINLGRHFNKILLITLEASA